MPAAAPGIRIHHHELRSMPMTRPPAPATIVPRGINALLAASCALAIAICAWPQQAHAQFTGNPSNDLTSQGSTDAARVSGSSGTPDDADTDSNSGSTTRLRQSTSAKSRDSQTEPRLVVPRERYLPGEFERYVQDLPEARDARRFGANLVTDDAIASAAQDPLPSVPGDYIVRPGDEIRLALWGTVDADLLLTVDRAGRITVPRVGAVTVPGRCT